MVFYAYVKRSTDDWSARYVITFASRAVADEWWRAVSTCDNTNFTSNIHRVSPQFYTHDPNNGANAANSLTTKGVATDFLNKVFFLLMDDLNGRQLSIIPSPSYFVDHISGQSFYIRSTVSPYEYWYYPPPSDNPAYAIYLSRTERTRFRVRRTASNSAGTVMVGSDGIVITLLSANLSIQVTSTTGQVIVSTTPMAGLTFGDLSKFIAGPTLYKDGVSLDKKELFYSDEGGDWELA
ncbi:hypothetical protein F4604DRAFT_850752 [Suillus subluteus]|nr:hypothetical protein F4604DRAFT_850752 [Suillus subluteus]